MVCVYCGNKTQVINSRHQKRNNGVWRRRQCKKCMAVFTSLEQVDTQTSLVVNKSGRLEPFSRDKVLISLYDSLKHRKTATSDASGLADTIVNQAFARNESSEIGLNALKSIILSTLDRFDPVSAVHFQAYYIA